MMETTTGPVTELNDEVLQRIQRIQQNAQFLKNVGFDKMTPRRQKQMLSTGRTKVGRNAPCPCGATFAGPNNTILRRKFKVCCLNKPHDRLLLDVAREATKHYV